MNHEINPTDQVQVDKVSDSQDIQTTSQEQEQNNHNVVAVFVVQFDVHKGNVIEWQYPTDFDLEGVEYQSICSGLHRIKSDIVYFSRDDLYGISAFQNMPIESERGAYMKAIGVITRPTHKTGICGNIWKHEEFLKQELSGHMIISETIEPSRYESLLSYYTHNQYRGDDGEPVANSKNFKHPDLKGLGVNFNLRQNPTKNLYNNGENMDFGLDILPSFINTFGPDVFIVWKAALLRKRIVLIDMPPMEKACKYVYIIQQIGKVPVEFENNLIYKDVTPKFTVGVNDIPILEKSQSYVACTPDTIFQIKSDLYDVLITLSSPLIKPTTTVTTTDTTDTTTIRPTFKSPIHFLSNHNSADFTRFRVIWNYLTLKSKSWTEFIALEPSGLFGTSSAAIHGFYTWLYQDYPTPTTSIFSTSRLLSSWQNIFAGGNSNNSSRATDLNRFNSQQSLTTSRIYLNQTSLLCNDNNGRSNANDSSRDLLLTDEDEDATEIDNNNVLEAVRASAEIHNNSLVGQQKQQQEEATRHEEGESLLGFFHSLTYYLLTSLESIISINQEEDLHIIPIYPKDMVQLGLDPQKDIAFVTELAQLYFKKRVHVKSIHMPYVCDPFATCSVSSCCCCNRARRNSEEEGAIRI